MADVVIVVLGNAEDLTASRTVHMKHSATITFTYAVDEREPLRRAVERHKAKRDFRITVPENASILAAGARTAWPSSRIEIVKTVERQQADAHRSLGASLRRRRMSVRTNEIAMGGPYVFHHSPEGLYFFYVDLTFPPLCVDDNPPRVIGVMPCFDKNVDLSPDTRDGTHD
jgi:hypothetical protein